MDQMPAGQLDRNPYPVSGSVKMPSNNTAGIKEVVVPDHDPTPDSDI
jgi:hypothetical protein